MARHSNSIQFVSSASKLPHQNQFRKKALQHPLLQFHHKCKIWRKAKSKPLPSTAASQKHQLLSQLQLLISSKQLQSQFMAKNIPLKWCSNCKRLFLRKNYLIICFLGLFQLQTIQFEGNVSTFWWMSSILFLFLISKTSILAR